MPDRLLSPRLILRPANPAELTAAAAKLGFPADPMPDDLAAGWLIERKRDGRLAGLVSVTDHLTCVLESGCRRRGYASEALARLALDGEMPPRLKRPPTAAARGLVAKIGYRPDRDREMLIDSAVATQCATLSREWRAGYRRRVEECHRRLGIAEGYAESRALKLVAEAERLRGIGRDMFDREQYLAPAAASAWQRLKRSAADDSVVVTPVSAYRGLDYQTSLIERKLASGLAIDDILCVTAAPGFSEHHSGLALDVSTPESPPLEEAFATTAAYRWLSERAGDFGFRLSYPRDNPHGIAFEPWHWAWHEPQET